jgi:hypothetical protein
MKKSSSIVVSCLFFGILAFTACQKALEPIPDDISSRAARAQANESPGFVENDMVLIWNDYMNRVLAVSGGAPPVQFRHSAMVQLAVHDALNAIKPKYDTYALNGVRNKDANPDATVASAAYHTMKKIQAFVAPYGPPFAINLQTPTVDWEGWYTGSIASIQDDPQAIEAGKQLGEAAATAIMNKRVNDGFAETLPVYTVIAPPAVAPAAGVWRPTISAFPIPAYHTGGLPKWGLKMQSFSGLANDQFVSADPVSLSSATYAADYNEVKLMGARTGSGRNADQSQIANFWQERPVTIWNRVARESLKTKKNDAWKSARLLALVNVGLFDGLLLTFDGLYRFNRWRPETAIRLGNTDGNDATEADADWLPFTTDIPPGTFTPPIPEYPSANALGWAAAKVMQQVYGTDKTSISLISLDPLSVGVVRQYNSFSALGEECILSRLYAGFNFRHSIDAGRTLGTRVGLYVQLHILGENKD